MGKFQGSSGAERSHSTNHRSIWVSVEGAKGRLLPSPIVEHEPNRKGSGWATHLNDTGHSYSVASGATSRLQAEVKSTVTGAALGGSRVIAVRNAIELAKGGDLLAPVHVIVTSNLAGLSLRRLLGSRALEPDGSPAMGPAGIANVNFSTPFQFASLLAAPTLATSGQRPLTTAVLAAAVRHVLATDPGRFGDVAEHVATETALIRAYAEITEMPPARRQALTASTVARTRDLLSFVDAVEQHLRSGTSVTYHDEHAVFVEAAKTLKVEAPDAAIILSGPFGQGQSTLEFLSSLVKAAPASGVWALTGDADVDASATSQAKAIFGTDVDAPPVSMARPSTLLPAADADEEVRLVVRRVLAAAERGVRFERMAIFVPTTNPYLRSVREQLELAGVPAAGPDHRRLVDSMVGRLLIRLIEIADTVGAVAAEKSLDRETVLALTEAAPLRGPDGTPIRSGPWETISRQAGVVAGPDEWANRLGAHIASIDDRLARHADRGASSGYLAAQTRERDGAVALAEFVAWLAERVSPAAIGRSWEQRSNWARELLADLLPHENNRQNWPDTEVEAGERVDALLARVGVLDDIDPNPNSGAFSRALQLELDAPAGRRGRFGTGVYVAPLASAPGVDLDEVFIVGLAEGVCPRPVREDTLLPDSERELTGGALPTRADRVLLERSRFLNAVAAGAGSCTILSPLGDHRSGRDRTASRWWVEAVRANIGDDSINSQTWSETSLFTDEQHGSFSQSLTTAVRSGIATSAADLQLHYVHARGQLGADIADTDLAPPLQRGLAQIRERLAGFNRFNGDIDPAVLTSPVTDGKAISSSRLETWAGCPRRFYFEQVLGLGEIERPEEIKEISALDRGSLIHEILEDFIDSARPGGEHERTGPDHRWNDNDRERLLAIAQARYRRYEELGRTGRPILWAIRREETNADLETFLNSDSDLRAELRTTPREVELAFGLDRPPQSASDDAGEAAPRDRAEAAQVQLSDGRTVALRGLVDRVDWRSVDETPVVLDYKTGRKVAQSVFDTDPVSGGTKLQLGVYAEAVTAHYKSKSAQAYYWYSSSKGEFKTAGYPWTEDRRERFLDAIHTIIGGIESGDFPPNPGDYNSFRRNFENCSYCPFDRICPIDRDEELERAVKSGRLVEFVAMHSYDATDTESEADT